MAEIAIVFHGPINHPATTRLRNALCGAVNGGFSGGNRPDKIHLLMNSSGGSLDDGFSLYNLLRSIGIPLVTVNMGQIASIANVPFLAGDYRIACPNTIFHFHDFDWNFGGPHTMSRDQLTDTAQQLAAARANKKAIFEARTKLTGADLEALKFLEEPMIKDVGFAKEKGIIDEITIPAFPAGTSIINADY